MEALSPEPTARGLESEFATIARESPEFTGFYYDSTGALIIAEPSTRDHSRLTGAVKVVLERVGHRLASADGRERAVLYKAAKYSFAELAAWCDSLAGTPDPRGVACLDLGEFRNDIAIGVVGDEGRRVVTTFLADRAVPSGMVRLVASDYTRNTQDERV
jgi:hypothetical protein